MIATTPAPARLFAQIYQEWYLWLLIAQGISMALVLFACGRPKTMGQWLAIAAMNLFLVLLAALHAFSLLEYLCLRFLQVLLRVAVVGCWTFAVVGTPIVVYWIWRRSRGIRKPLPLAKCWFACLILVLVAEPVAYVIKSTRERLNIPVLPAGQTDGEFHVAAIGESSMIGWPYVSRADDKGTVDPRFCIPAVYAWRLGQFYPEKKIVMHNIAVQGLSVKLAIEQLSKLKQRPDLILVYAGHNEFYHDVEELSTQSKPLFYWLDRHLNASPTFYLVNSELAARSALRELVVGEGRVFAEHPVSNRLTFQHRLERFRRQLEQFAGYCRDNGITSQWIVPASAESVYEPDRSVVSEGTSSSEVNRMRSRYDEALVLEQSKKWQEAAAIYREELVKQPGFAEFHFRLAECLVEMGQYDEAHKEFVLARDTDAARPGPTVTIAGKLPRSPKNFKFCISMRPMCCDPKLRTALSTGR
nr:hypothetical protein [uncultured bacterium]